MPACLASQHKHGRAGSRRTGYMEQGVNQLQHSLQAQGKQGWKDVKRGAVP